VVDLIRGLARDQGISVLMVTHDPRILDIADRLVRMEDGQLIESGQGDRLWAGDRLPERGVEPLQ
jgi:putative ABC transport system ATP-binding protein